MMMMMMMYIHPQVIQYLRCIKYRWCSWLGIQYTYPTVLRWSSLFLDNLNHLQRRRLHLHHLVNSVNKMSFHQHHRRLFEPATSIQIHPLEQVETKTMYPLEIVHLELVLQEVDI